ncbi:hypothetical protein BO70DRAFT_364139 [Aspergillus heteromorphus CBS 117.55]|uniref:Uncharacterized protein n=1 Tax=Aspergillus heteromorphus CBS 117.55 TaxID=1448321 RepID=A0A317VP75_9EURO|nr:uncharacterized protein BO70DRAFT_364139 [Aspergillus heteromorphus CBS 117.55]PWY75061.1 hypothetical protein BO70DRAFT_364139 [Aspergillus heteromorphus CBS 117.55]
MTITIPRTPIYIPRTQTPQPGSRSRISLTGKPFPTSAAKRCLEMLNTLPHLPSVSHGLSNRKLAYRRGRDMIDVSCVLCLVACLLCLLRAAGESGILIG